MSRLAILGASGHGKVIADAALAQGWREVLFFDDNWPSVLNVGSWKVLGTTEELIESSQSFDAAVVGIGNNRTRQFKSSLLEEVGVCLATVVHPSAVVSSLAALGCGSVVFANATVNAGAVVGAGAIINTGAIVEHDCELSEYVHVSPRALLAGGVQVGCRAWVGAGACVMQSLRVGEDAVLGMGSVVLSHVGAGETVVGNPGRVLDGNAK